MVLSDTEKFTTPSSRISEIVGGYPNLQSILIVVFNCYFSVHFDKYKLFPPTNALFIKT
jgi:hypothetical protein